MNYAREERKILEELERRKDAKDTPCESWHGTGMCEEKACSDCLGQGILLSREEWDTLIALGHRSEYDDSILDQQEFEYNVS